MKHGNRDASGSRKPQMMPHRTTFSYDKLDAQAGKEFSKLIRKLPTKESTPRIAD